jgi:hypothetical protein
VAAALSVRSSFGDRVCATIDGFHSVVDESSTSGVVQALGAELVKKGTDVRWPAG